LAPTDCVSDTFTGYVFEIEPPGDGLGYCPESRRTYYISDRVDRFCPFPKPPDWTGAHRLSYSMGKRALSQGGSGWRLQFSPHLHAVKSKDSP